MSNVFDLLRQGFEEQGKDTVEQLEQKIKEAKSEQEKAELESRLIEAKKLQGKKHTPKEESLDEAMKRRFEQREENEQKRQKLKKMVLDRRTGKYVEVDENLVHHTGKKH